MSLFRRALPVARRFLGERHEETIRLRWGYAWALYNAGGATLDDLREAVVMLEETERTARSVFGNSHPLVLQIEEDARKSRKALADARASSEQLALAALAFVAAVAFLAGRRYLRR